MKCQEYFQTSAEKQLQDKKSLICLETLDAIVDGTKLNQNFVINPSSYANSLMFLISNKITHILKQI